MEKSPGEELYLIMHDGKPYGYCDSLEMAKEVIKVWADWIISINNLSGIKIKRLEKDDGIVVNSKRLGTIYNDPFYRTILDLRIKKLKKLLPILLGDKSSVPIPPPLPSSK